MVIGGTTYNGHSAPVGLNSESGSIPAQATSAYSRDSPSTTFAAESASPTLSESASEAAVAEGAGSHKIDRRVGIIVGVVVGVVALALMGFLFLCLRRRKRSTGSYFNGRADSVSDSEIGAWRHSQPEILQNNNDSYESGDPSQEWVDRYNRSAEYRTPPISKHPAFAGHYTQDSSSEENPFFTPEERSAAAASKQNSQATTEQHTPAELAHEEMTRSSASTARPSASSNPNRPPTPLDFMMIGNKAQQPVRHKNPFSSPEDTEAIEADDAVSPIVPTKHLHRRHSPQVHYPSWSEMSEFNFTDEARSYGAGRSLREQSSGSDGDDGWRPLREKDSVVGRHELA